MTTSVTAPPPGDRVSIVIGGHVDHGKSTIIGRLLADTHSLPEGELEQVKALCARTARPFEYAVLLDALKDERAQGITIDAARVFFRTPTREYTIIDAPRHIGFLKNMITAAARAEAALLVIDAHEGVQDNSRRHGYLMAMLGIHHLAVLVNAVDRITCCSLLKTEALRKTLSGEWPRYRFNAATHRYEVDLDTAPFTRIFAGVRADEEGSRSVANIAERSGRAQGAEDGGGLETLRRDGYM